MLSAHTRLWTSCSGQHVSAACQLLFAVSTYLYMLMVAVATVGAVQPDDPGHLHQQNRPHRCAHAQAGLPPQAPRSDCPRCKHTCCQAHATAWVYILPSDHCTCRVSVPLHAELMLLIVSGRAARLSAEPIRFAPCCCFSATPLYAW